VEGGRQVKNACLEFGISEARYYVWKLTLGGMEASDVRRFTVLEEENSCLKRVYPDLALESTALKDVIARKL
jgi:putative transposase